MSAVRWWGGLAVLTALVSLAGPHGWAEADDPDSNSLPEVESASSAHGADKTLTDPPASPGRPIGTQGRGISVYLTPHQDDETLSMGQGIAADVAAGRMVYIVLATDGTSTAHLRRMNQHLAALHGAGGAPKRLTQGVRSQARNAELIAAASRLGVPRARVTFLDKHEGAVNESVAKDVVAGLIARFGESARYNTMSWLDAQPVHYHLGYAFRAACLTNKRLSCRFFQASRYQPATTDLDSALPVVTPKGGWLTGHDRAVRAAAAEYAVWSPRSGRYAVGATSVRPYFSHLKRNPRNWWHVVDRPGAWPSAAAERNAARWARAHQNGDKGHKGDKGDMDLGLRSPGN